MIALLTLVSLAHAEPHASVAAVAIDGRYNTDGIDWTATFETPVTYAGVWQIPLAVPLPDGTTVESGAVPVIEDGRIVGLDVSGKLPRVKVALHQPVGFGDTVLAAPIAVAGTPERLTLEGVAFTADPGLRIETHLGFASQPAMKAKDRRTLDRALGGGPKRSESVPMYFLADDRLVDAGGLVGTLAPSGVLSRGFTWTMGAVFASVLAFLALLARFAQKMAQAESVDAYIKKEFVKSARAVEPEAPRG
jgi:hypothetical protein